MSPFNLPALVVYFLCAALPASATIETEQFYFGSVVEFHNDWDSSITAEENIVKNAERYSSIINEAATTLVAKNETFQLDIIVFPEMGLTGRNISYYIEIPDPDKKITPWNQTSPHEVLKILSTAANNSKTYVVVNLLELFKSGNETYQYNTNVVFNRDGTIIARYRKFNLFGETYLNRTKEPEYTYFDTDFGVKFGTFTCFDILFSEPALGLINKYNVTDIAFPTFWFSELPFLTAIQEQQSWVFGTNVTLLASGQNDVDIGSTGSGIYSPPSNKGGQNFVQYTQNVNYTTITSQIYKKSASGASNNQYSKKNENMLSGKNSGKSLKLIAEDLEPYETKLLTVDSKAVNTPQNGSSTKTFIVQNIVCKNDFCCNFTLEVSMKLMEKSKWQPPTSINGDEMYRFRYRMVAGDGKRSFTNKWIGGLQVCGIIPCLDETLEKCALSADSQKDTKPYVVKENNIDMVVTETTFKEISINGIFISNDSFLFPNVIETSTEPHQFGKLLGKNSLTFTKSEEKGIVLGNLEARHSNSEIKLISAALYNRVFSRDGPQTNNKAPFTNMSITLVLAATIMFLLAYLY